jgi:hypothetical protein
MNYLRKVLILSVALAFTAVLASSASAQSLGALLEGSQEVPPNPSPAIGLGCFTYAPDGMVSYYVVYSGLLASETASHVHGPAPRGSNAEVLFPLPLGSSKIGSFGPITPAQLADFMSGLWYVNVHSTLYPFGEIRGQIDLSCTVPVDATTWGAIKALYR